MKMEMEMKMPAGASWGEYMGMGVSVASVSSSEWFWVPKKADQTKDLGNELVSRPTNGMWSLLLLLLCLIHI